MFKFILKAIGLLLVVVVGVFVADWINKNDALQLILPPDFQLVGHHATSEISGMDMAYVYSAQVKNKGFTGSMIVVCECVDRSGNKIVKAKRLRLKRDETKTVEFQFSEVSAVDEAISALRGSSKEPPKFRVFFNKDSGAGG